MPKEGLEFSIFSPQPFRGWGYRRASPHWVHKFKFFSFVVLKKYASSLFAKTVCISSGGCFILLPFPVAVTKYLIKGNLHKKGLVPVYICVWEGAWQESQGKRIRRPAGHTASTVRVIVKGDRARKPQGLLPVTSSCVHNLPKQAFHNFKVLLFAFRSSFFRPSCGGGSVTQLPNK